MSDPIENPPMEPGELGAFEPLPKWPKVIGIISIIWAGLGLMCTGCGLVFIPFQAGMVQSQLNGAPLPPNLVMGPLDYIIGAVGFILIVVLLVAGISTVRRKPTGRPLHLVYGFGSLPVLVANGWNVVQKNGPAMQQWVRDYPDNPIAQQQAQFGSMGVIIGIAMVALIGLPWPVFCLIWFGLVKRRGLDLTQGLGDEPAA